MEFTNEDKLSELTKKVLAGIKEANRKLVEESAALGRSLVVFVDGETKHVPAKELLAKMNKSE